MVKYCGMDAERELVDWGHLGPVSSTIRRLDARHDAQDTCLQADYCQMVFLFGPSRVAIHDRGTEHVCNCMA